MNATIIFAILLASIGGYLLLARGCRRLSVRLGVAGGSIVSADDSRLPAPNLYSERFGLVGRCDHLMRVGRAYVPVEQKPTAQRLHDSHVLQVGALCLLVQDVYGTRRLMASSSWPEAKQSVSHFHRPRTSRAVHDRTNATDSRGG